SGARTLRRGDERLSEGARPRSRAPLRARLRLACPTPLLRVEVSARTEGEGLGGLECGAPRDSALRQSHDFRRSDRAGAMRADLDGRPSPPIARDARTRKALWA